MIIFSDKVKSNKEAFLQKVVSISNLLGINPNWLMAVMYMESTLNPQAVNKQKADTETDAYKRAAYRATGLIQFMPATAEALGTSTQKLYLMNNLQQLDFVYKYYKPYTNRIQSLEDLYTVTFFPRALGKPHSFVFETAKLKASVIAQQNQVFDANKDGKITYGEFLSTMKKILQQKLGNDLYADIAQKKNF